GAFEPSAAGGGGRIPRQGGAGAVTLPSGTITSAPTSLDAGQAGNFSGNGTGDGLLWNFDGGAAPASGSPVSATFTAAGTFTVRLRATKSEGLAASGLDN